MDIMGRHATGFVRRSPGCLEILHGSATLRLESICEVNERVLTFLVYNHVLRLNLVTRQWNLVDNYGDIPGVRMGRSYLPYFCWNS